MTAMKALLRCAETWDKQQLEVADVIKLVTYVRYKKQFQL